MKEIRKLDMQFRAVEDSEKMKIEGKGQKVIICVEE